MKTLSANDLKTIWSRILNSVEESKEVDKQTFSSFFKDTKIYSIENKTIIVICTQDYISDVINDTYKDLILKHILKITGTDYDVAFVSENEVKDKDKVDVLKNASINVSYFDKIKLSSEYNFDNFIEGVSNKEAKKASLLVANNPGTLYNPLYIQGNSGLGKTHLLNAIGNFIKNKDPKINVLYTSSQVFIEEYINFAKGNTSDLALPDFIKKFDVLLMDDIQQLKDKTKTLDFFFDIYNYFYTNHKQIVITSDRYQSNLEGIPDRLVTRFLQGLTVSITQPDNKTSKEILKIKMKSLENTNLTIDEDVLDLIADNFKDSIRSLEGALLRLTFCSSLQDVNHIDLNFALTALGNMIKVSSINSKTDENRIIEQVCDLYKVSYSQITGKLKTAQVSNARQVAIYLIRDILDMPYQKIGEIFAKRDHSTIMHACTKVENSLKEKPELKKIIDKLKKELQ